MTTNEILVQALTAVAPTAYMAFFHDDPGYPHIVYRGSGQNVLYADNAPHYKSNTYIVEYYYDRKDEATESAVEDALVAAGFTYSKSEDAYIDSDNVFVIYYYTEYKEA